MNHKCNKCKSTTPSATFVSHDSNINDFASVFEIIFDVLLFSAVKYASNKELNINRISCWFGFRRLFHWLPKLKLLLLLLSSSIFNFRLNLSRNYLGLTQGLSNCLEGTVGFIRHVLSQRTTIF
jgi:hypothetical protein